MNDAPDHLSDLAEAVADGATVDWPAVEQGTDADQLPIVRALRDVESVIGAHRQVLAGSDAQARRRRPQRLGIGDSWGSLEIRGFLGGGGFGDVYKAFDPKLRREVALKLLSAPDDVDEALLLEARLLAKVNHANVVKVFNADRIDGHVGIVMEWLQGHTLTAELAQFGPLGAEAAVVVGMKLCDALAEVHRQSVVHRDVKAQNVMREPGGRIVLMDFGIGLDESSDRGLGPAGTPAYLAPELLAGGKAGVATDIYALGVLLFHLVTHEFPVRGKSLAEFRQRHAAADVLHLPDLRSDLPEAFVRVVETALEPDPARRFSSAGTFHRALSRAMASAILGEAWQGVAARGPWWRRFGVGSGILGAVVAGLLLWMIDSSRSDPPTKEIRVLLDRVEDRSGDEAFAGSIDAALRSSVRASHLFEPVTSTDERQLSRQMWRADPEAPFDGGELRDAALRAAAPAILGGELLRTDEAWELNLWLAATSDLGDRRSAQVALPRLTMATLEGALQESLADLETAVRDWQDSAVQVLEASALPVLESATTDSLTALQLYTAGLQAYRQGDIETSESNLRAAVQQDPEFALAQLHLGHSLAAQGNPTGALQQFRRAFELRQRTATDLERWTLEGAYYASVRQYRQAIEAYQQVLDIVEEDPSTRRQLALAHLALGQLDQAVLNARLGRGERLNHGLLVFILATAGQPQLALEEAEGIRRSYGVTPYLLWSEGLALLGLERLEEALDRTRTLNAEASGTYRNLASWLEARIHLFAGDLTSAAEVLYRDRRTDAIEGTDFLGIRRRYWTARCQAIRGQYRNALGVLDSLELATIPAHLTGWRSVAVLRAELGDTVGAEAILERLEHLHGEYPSLISEMVTSQVRAEVLLAKGDARAAVDQLRRADGPSDVSFVRTTARAHAALGDFEEAVFLDARLLDRKGEILDQDFVGFWVEALVRRARGLERLNREVEAEAAWGLARKHWGEQADAAFGAGAPGDALPWPAPRPGSG